MSDRSPSDPATNCGHARDFSGVTHLCVKPTGHTGAHTSGSASWGVHEWVRDHPRWPSLRGFTFCVRCGVVQRTDGENKPCKEQLPKLSLRESPSDPAPLRQLLEEAQFALMGAHGYAAHDTTRIELAYRKLDKALAALSASAVSAPPPQGECDMCKRAAMVYRDGTRLYPMAQCAIHPPAAVRAPGPRQEPENKG
jgi:hypothetical protein